MHGPGPVGFARSIPESGPGPPFQSEHMSRKRKTTKKKRSEGGEAAPEQNGGKGTTHLARAICVAGATGRANPLTRTNIRIGGGEISDRPTPDQFLAELANVADLAEYGTATPTVMERIAGLLRWVEQDREWRHSGYDAVTFEQLEIQLKALKLGLESGGHELKDVSERLRAMHRVVARETAIHVNVPESGRGGAAKGASQRRGGRPEKGNREEEDRLARAFESSDQTYREFARARNMDERELRLVVGRARKRRSRAKNRAGQTP